MNYDVILESVVTLKVRFSAEEYAKFSPDQSGWVWEYPKFKNLVQFAVSRLAMLRDTMNRSP